MRDTGGSRRDAKPCKVMTQSRTVFSSGTLREWVGVTKFKGTFAYNSSRRGLFYMGTEPHLIYSRLMAKMTAAPALNKGFVTKMMGKNRAEVRRAADTDLLPLRSAGLEVGV